jgi:hypothetical protein
VVEEIDVDVAGQLSDEVGRIVEPQGGGGRGRAEPGDRRHAEIDVSLPVL